MNDASTATPRRENFSSAKCEIPNEAEHSPSLDGDPNLNFSDDRVQLLIERGAALSSDFLFLDFNDRPIFQTPHSLGALYRDGSGVGSFTLILEEIRCSDRDLRDNRRGADQPSGLAVPRAR